MNIASVDQVRAAENAAVSTGIAEYELMLRAGRGAARIIREYFPGKQRIAVLCGGGNNGGDALAVAALLKGDIHVFSTKKAAELTGAAGCAARDLPEHIPFTVCESLEPEMLASFDLLIDGLLGIGFKGKSLRKNAASFIRSINCSRLPVAALDVPSGLDCDTGDVPDQAVRADLTITFGAVKRGLLCGKGPELCGVLRTVDIGLADVSEDDRAVTFEDVCRMLPRFGADVHKNRKGELLVAAGSFEYSGAAALTASAALRGGAGIVRLATVKARPGLPFAVICREYPEQETLPADLAVRCADWLDRSTALAAGPGWGNVSPGVLCGLLTFKGPVVLDADALNLIARHPELWQKRDNAVWTPHPGEAARLAAAFGIQAADRETLAKELARKTGAVILLKGKFTRIASPDGREAVILAGSPALATAGSGDVLTGIIGALLANGLAPFEAASAGAACHGRAGELAGNGAVADDLLLTLKAVLKEL